jgi:hypothetical protein
MNQNQVDEYTLPGTIVAMLMIAMAVCLMGIGAQLVGATLARIF